MFKLIDTHCHVNFEDYDADRDDVISRAQDKLDAVIVSGTSLESNIQLLDLVDEYKEFLYPTFGFHPLTSQDSTEEELKEAQNYLIENRDKFVAIGEVGTDYFYVKEKPIRERQREIFKSFMDIANDYKIPLQMHVRDSERKAFNLLEDYEDIPYCIFHCYGGSMKTARRIMEKGNYYMSFSTMVCYSQRHQELIKDIPLDFVLTETDSPYLAMTKEERNEPANVSLAVEKIAEIKDLDVATVDEVTTENAKKVFNI
ncbi:MAG: TatD family hydrolase [Methanobrevibacter sp.]|nr:TatD family hydrolase [Methanobrevibacter sp.]MDO5849259.1 TatD family hydrolase [Methanobrevibacter sp.]